MMNIKELLVQYILYIVPTKINLTLICIIKYTNYTINIIL